MEQHFPSWAFCLQIEGLKEIILDDFLSSYFIAVCLKQVFQLSKFIKNLNWIMWANFWLPRQHNERPPVLQVMQKLACCFRRPAYHTKYSPDLSVVLAVSVNETKSNKILLHVNEHVALQGPVLERDQAHSQLIISQTSAQSQRHETSELQNEENRLINDSERPSWSTGHAGHQRQAWFTL